MVIRYIIIGCPTKLLIKLPAGCIYNALNLIDIFYIPRCSCIVIGSPIEPLLVDPVLASLLGCFCPA